MKLEKTRFSFLATLAVLAGAFGWSLGRLWPHWFQMQMSIPMLNAWTMWLIALSLLIWTIVARPKLLRKKNSIPLPPIVAARSAALALAGSRVGALVLGFYLGLLALNLNLPETPDGNDRLITIGLIVLAAILLIGTAIWLERLCQVKQPPSDDGATAKA